MDKEMKMIMENFRNLSKGAQNLKMEQLLEENKRLKKLLREGPGTPDYAPAGEEGLQMPAGFKHDTATKGIISMGIPKMIKSLNVLIAAAKKQGFERTHNDQIHRAEKYAQGIVQPVQPGSIGEEDLKMNLAHHIQMLRQVVGRELGGAVRGVDADELDDRGNLIDDENAGIFGSLT